VYENISNQKDLNPSNGNHYHNGNSHHTNGLSVKNPDYFPTKELNHNRQTGGKETERGKTVDDGLFDFESSGKKFDKAAVSFASFQWFQ
jgi:hypothetical protein